MKSNNIVGNKAYSFEIEIVNLYKNLSIDKKGFILSKQILKSGTSIGVNIQEGLSGESKKDLNEKVIELLKLLNSIILFSKKSILTLNYKLSTLNFF